MPLLRIPPPVPVAVLPLIVLSLTVNVVVLPTKMAPPFCPVFPLITLALMVSAGPEAAIAPPSSPLFPFRIVIPARVTFPPVALNAETLSAEPFRIVLPAPAPVIIMSLVRLSASIGSCASTGRRDT